MKSEGDFTITFSKAILVDFVYTSAEILAQCTVATPPYLDAPSSLLLCRNVGLSTQFLVHFLLVHTQTPYALEFALQTLETYLSQSGQLLNIQLVLITGADLLCEGEHFVARRRIQYCEK